MHVMLATAHPYMPQIAGGAQSNMHELALALRARGHDVTIVSGLTKAGRVGLAARGSLTLLHRPFHRETSLGYQTFRSWFPWRTADAAVSRAQPDVVVAQSGLPAKIAGAFRQAGVPTIIHFHNIEANDLEGVSVDSADAYLANSRFTARYVAKTFGIHADVMVPTFLKSRYETDRAGEFVTFINPHPNKGVDLMLEVVRRMPDVRFLFVKAWTLTEAQAATLSDAQAGLANLTVMDAVAEMRAVYRRTKVLVMPSRWEEAWGRVATEAHFSGIPVIGSNRGGIPEAIGPGGLVMEANAAPEAWVDALHALLHDEDLYEKLSEAALAYSQRPAIDIESQVDAFLQICADTVATVRSRSRTPVAIGMS
jgi:glycosyltransferase involved in cell wall biosynthesis